MAESFGVEDRGHFYDPVGALRDVVVNHLMQVVAAAAMEVPSRSDADTLKNSSRRALPLGRARRSRSTTCAASTTATARSTAWLPTRPRRRTRRSGSRSRTGAGRVCRSSSGPASGCPSRRPSCGSSSSGRHGSGFARGRHRAEANQLVVKLDPSTGIRLDRRRAPRRHGRPGADHARHGVRRGGRRRSDALRGAPARRARSETRNASRDRTPSRRRGA